MASSKRPWRLRTVSRRTATGIWHVTDQCPRPSACDGAFYAYPSFEALLGKNIRGHQIDTTLDLAAALLEQAKVAIVPGEAFGAGGAARLSFALGDDDLGEGVQRIVDFLA